MMTTAQTRALLSCFTLSLLAAPATAQEQPPAAAAPSEVELPGQPPEVQLPDPSATPWVVSEPVGLAREVPQPLQYRREFGIIPLVGGDSDIGIAVGTVGSLASFRPYASPYAWRLELNALASFKKEGAAWVNPFQDYYLKLTVPSLSHNTVSLTARLAFTRYSTLKYYGLGDASVVPKQVGLNYTEYQLTYPHATFEVAHKFARPWLWRLTLDYFYEVPRVYANSKLAADLAQNAPPIGVNDRFHLATVTAGLGYDSRDDETAPELGQNHSISARYAPGYKTVLPYHYVGLNASLRAYVPLWHRHLMLALRAVGDGLVGNPPFFMLAESVDGYAVGGVSGVRGVPAQRYYGKIKAYGTGELRLRFSPHRAFGQEMVWGLVAFGDAGRVWADWKKDPTLDGTGAGIKYGVGGGIRMQWGATFLIRGDVAWSPDADPLGFYFNVGHIF
jgi:outer membrane protein assembly factor BamA